MSAREAYAFGRIDESELERRLEHEELRRVGRAHPVPEGWDPLPPCDHSWIEITQLGSMDRQMLCVGCGDERREAF